MLRRLRQALRTIDYYSAARPRTVWDRMGMAALLIALALALPLTWLADVLVARVEPVDAVTGRLLRVAGTSEFIAAIPRADGSTIWTADALATSPYGEFTLGLTDATRGWPFPTTIQRSAPTLNISANAEAAERTAGRANADPAIVAAVDAALAVTGEMDMRAAWLNPQPGPSHRHWPGWLANALIFLVALVLGLNLLVQSARFVAWSLRERSRYQQFARSRRNVCPGCAYDLRGLDFGARCPECGTLLS
jgi:hypothetical protein